ncbi:hypothetical protein [Sphingomonas arenae]|uniref:hypothetical protein n=1 Tax=Sphingomonas arenae TaxID=2812555 RepID=UPI001966F07A|nr:hypothetical protein [Sphingomonas arenae]
MRDELFDRDFQAGRADLFAGVDRLVHSVALAFEYLHQRQWDAPWKHDRRRSKKAGVA